MREREQGASGPLIRSRGHGREGPAVTGSAAWRLAAAVATGGGLQEEGDATFPENPLAV